MLLPQLTAALLLSAAPVRAAVNLLTDISQISRSWGQISIYADNDEDYFGVDYVGLPDGCQVVSITSTSPIDGQSRNID